MLVFKTLLLSILLLPLVDHVDDGKETRADLIEKSEWNHVKCYKGVNLYERLITANELQVSERKGELVVDCDFNTVTKFFSVPENMKFWMKGVKKAYCLRTDSINKWTVHTTYRLPWPFANKDMVSAYEFKQYGTNKCVIQIISIDDMMEESSNMERITNFRANCMVTKIDDQKTKIVFSVICATPPIMPRWIQDPIVKRIFLKNMILMKKQLLRQSN